MFAILLTIGLNVTSSNTITVGSYPTEVRCNEVMAEIKKSYVGSDVRVFSSRCIPTQ